MKLPIVLRKRHDKEVRQLRSTISSNLVRHDRELEETTKRLDEFLPRLFKIKTSPDYYHEQNPHK